MAYNSMVEMANDGGLRDRCIAAAAGEGESQPEGWVANNMWHLAASPGWADAWAYARDVATINVNPETGERDDVISDNMILAAVQARRSELAAAPA